jgi:hypothetical protein
VGALKRLGSEEIIRAGACCLIGRSSACEVRVENPRVSGQHASVRWTGSAWELRDLGSKNGTFLAGKRLASGGGALLLSGNTFTLGGKGTAAVSFALVDASPPVASARHLPSGTLRGATAGLLVLPDDEHPQVSIFEGRDGRWLMETAGEERPVGDREIVVVDGEAWCLDLPASTGVTLDIGPPTLDSLSMRFRVSADEERVEIIIRHGSKTTHLPSRSFHYMLLTLARARLASAHAPPEEQGWLSRDELCRMLVTDEHRLNVDICRARKHLAAAGVPGAANVVERLLRTGRIRLGVSHVEVEREPA